LRNPADHFVSGSIAEALNRIQFMVQHGRRFGILYGPRGIGKSSLFRYYANYSSRFPKQLTPWIDLAGVSPAGIAKRFRDALAEELGTADSRSEGESHGTSVSRYLQEFDELLLAHNAMGRRPVLLLDHAEDADKEIFQTLGILLRRPGQWSAILAMDESLLVEIPRRILEECDLRLDLPEWDLGLTAEYFEQAQSRCGMGGPWFTAQAITRLHELGDGVPRRMFQIADLAWLAGLEKRLDTIDSDLVEQVCDENSFGMGAHRVSVYHAGNG
jgi:general secretion pathway protein A